ncbi:aminopeptidase P family protein (plasmid) [Phyllobacterium zundukense]|uniref:Aminopeptidase P family protein n=1 Tax=Phyllobacterium zundukense TaxID=1867719 RepID=A0ACD4CV59_9HYPH|nr:aminopeptidase P family protein [Phyllobacterium zundukense]UXN57449.1 aminopeptidase P family protein [Phyllobacterium zundukense]
MTLFGWRLKQASQPPALERQRPIYFMPNVLSSRGFEVGTVGRFGHGLGKIVTEFPSNAPDDTTILEPGMVFTIEPSADYNGKIMAHEENIVIRKVALS